MDLRRLVQLLRRSWLLVLLVTLLGVAGAGTYVALVPPVHVATTQLYVSVRSGEGADAGDLVQGSSAAQQKVRSYVDVVRSRSVLGPVVDELDLDEDATDLARRVSASSPEDTVLVDVTVSDTDPDRARAVAAAIGRSLTRTVTEDLEGRPGDESLVHLATTEPATVLPTTTRPRPVRDVVLGLVLGFGGAVALVLLLSRLDIRIRSGEDVTAAVDRPVLASIGFDPDAQRLPLVVAHAPRDPRAEAYRALRTSLQFTSVDQDQQRFVVTSSMPGEGKSTTAANLAVAFAETGARVVLVDGDLRRPRIADLFGVEGVVGLTDVLIGRVELEDALQPWGQHDLHLLPAGSRPPNPSELLGSHGMSVLVDQLAADHDVVIVDAPPLLPVTDAAVLTKVAGRALVIACHGTTRSVELQRALETLETIGEESVGCVLTKVPLRDSPAYAYAYGAHDTAGPADRTARATPARR